MEAGSLPWLMTQYPQFWRPRGCSDPSSKFLPSSWLCLPAGNPSSYIRGHHGASLFTSKLKVWEPTSIQPPSLTRALRGPCILKTTPPPAWVQRSTRDSCSSSTSTKDHLPGFAPTVTQPQGTRSPANFPQTSCGWMFLQNVSRRVEFLRQNSWPQG